ncbi:hypothetical protein B1H18_23020 [Streptomyces tsukubensis]|uniref:Uncharacterized protein n=1 Tax=Streptomyces tsukubensis TaxID=83656 RepID=A0A1V4A4I2_9ACTN|nr:hypothetical protein B1H18_23020 [Streptomyces tsukubensis]
MTESRGGWKRQGFIPVSRQSSDRAGAQTPPRNRPPGLPASPHPAGAPPPPPPPPADRWGPSPEPLYSALLAEWSAEGRTLPGRPDPEWNSLIRGNPWPRA